MNWGGWIYYVGVRRAEHAFNIAGNNVEGGVIILSVLIFLGIGRTELRRFRSCLAM